MASFQKRFSLLFVLSAAGFALSFGNQLVVSYHFGTSIALDAYWALFAVVNFLSFYVHPLREALIPPVFAAVAVDREHASAVFSAGLALQVGLALLSMVLLLMAPKLGMVSLGLPEADSYSLLLGFLPFFVLYALAETCNGLLLSFNRAVHQAVARLASAAIGLACLWLLAGRVGVLALLFSLLIAQAITLLVSAFGVWGEGIRWTWRGFGPLWKAPRFKVVFVALLFNYLLAQVYVVCERITMLGLLPGLVASYQYSVALVNVLISLLAFPLVNLLWPRFLVQAAHGEVDVMLNTAAPVVAPLVLTLMAFCGFAERFSVEIVQALFARGSFDAASVAQTSEALRATVFAAIPISLVTIFSKILLSLGRGRAMAIVGAGIALIGIAVVLLASSLGSVALVQWHWVVANTSGLLVMMFLLLRRSTQPRRLVRAAFAWLSRAAVSVLLALWVAPSVASDGDAWSMLTGLVVSFAIFGVSTTVFASLVGVFDLRQIMGLRQ